MRKTARKYLTGWRLEDCCREGGAIGCGSGPVGRLGKAGEGLLLLPADARWAARLLDPASHVAKTYHVQVRGQPDAAALARLAAGLSAHGLYVGPSMYRIFVESLIDSVRAYDPQFDDQIESEWRDALRPGIEFMQARYGP